MNIGVKCLLAGSALVVLMGATEINIGVNNQVNTGTIVGGGCRKGNGVMVKQSHTLKPFRDLVVDGVFAVHLRCGEQQEVSVAADKNLQSLISAVVENGKLHLTTTESYCTDNTFVADIVQKQIGSITVEGSSDLTVDCNSFMGNHLAVELHGTSTMKISGSVQSLNLHVQDSAEFDGTRLHAQDVAVTASDAAVARLNVSGKLSGSGSGASEIHYLGTPKELSVDIEDASEVTPAE